MFKIHPTVPACMSEEAKSFIMRCFEPNPDKRATASNLLKDAFLKSSTKKKKTKPSPSLAEIEPITSGESARLLERLTLILRR